MLARDKIPNSTVKFSNSADRTILICPWKWASGLLLLVALAVIVQCGSGWQSVLAWWQKIPFPLLGLSFVLFVCSHILRAFRIYRYALVDKHCHFLGVLKLSAFHQFANNLLPMRLGEAAFPVLMRRFYGFTLLNGATRLICLRLFDAALMGLLVLVLMLAQAGLRSELTYLLPVIGAIFLALLLLSRLPHWVVVKKCVAPVVDALPASYQHAGELMAYTVAAWGCKLLAITLLICGFLPASTALALGGALGAEVGGIIPIHGFAGAGTFEAAFLSGASVVDSKLTLHELIGVAINLHIFVFMSTALVALLSAPIPVVASQTASRQSYPMPKHISKSECYENPEH